MGNDDGRDPFNEELENLVDLDEWQIREIDKGIADTDAGRTISHDEVCVRMSKLNVKARKPKAFT